MNNCPTGEAEPLIENEPSLSRRGFLETSWWTAAVATAMPLTAWARERKPSAGIQLYMVKDSLEKDPAGTLRQLASFGFEEIETAGFANQSPGEFRKLISDAGLRCPSAHLFFGFEDTAKLLDQAKVLGAEYVVSSMLLPGPPPIVKGDFSGVLKAANALTLEDFKRIAGLANHIAEQAKRAGLKYAYHNHNFEFRDHDGRNGYSILLAETDPDLVNFEADCGWMQAAGASPAEYLGRYPSRIRMIHIKDFLAGSGPTTTLMDPAGPKSTELGRGRIDFKPILAAAGGAGVEHYFVEQEPPFTDMPALEAAKVDCTYFRSLL